MGKNKRKIKDKYSELTNADLVWGRIPRKDLMNMISAKIVKAQKELLDEIDSFEFSS